MMQPSRSKGTIKRFFRNRGFGFITPEDGGDEVFVHWKSLITDDKWPSIKQGTEVEFELVEKDDDGKMAATDVSLPGGEKIPVFQVDSDRVTNEDEVYTGTIRFFDFRKGFGFIIPDETITWEGVTTTDDDDGGIYVRRDELVTDEAEKDMVLNLGNDKKVSFKVYKGEKGLGASEVQNEDGTPFELEKSTRTGKRKRSDKKDRNKKPKKKAKKSVKTKAKTKEELIAERETNEDESYVGTVKLWKEDREFGFIALDEEITFEGKTVTDRIYVMKEDIICYSDNVGLTADAKVIFKVYKDSRGLGAYEVMNEDGSPIQYGEIKEESEEPVKPAPSPKKKSTRRSSRKKKRN